VIFYRIEEEVPVLYNSRIFPLLMGAIAVVALFFIGMGIGLIAGAGPEAEVVEIEVPVEVQVVVPYPVPVPGPIVRFPVPFAIADEQIGAYRVNGYVTMRGPGRITTHRQIMACFPI
jgi:hypothetical protein